MKKVLTMQVSHSCKILILLDKNIDSYNNNNTIEL